MKNCLIIPILLILLSASAFALTATTLSGMIQMRLEEVPTTFEKSIGVVNDNNHTVYVFFTPSPDVADMMVMETYNVTLEPNETRFVKFNLTVEEMEKLVSSVVIEFSETSELDPNNKFAVSTSLIVLPVPSNQTQPENTTQNTTEPPVSIPKNNTTNISTNVSVNITENITANISQGNESPLHNITQNSTDTNSTEQPIEPPKGQSGLIIIAAVILLIAVSAFIIINKRKGAKNE